MAKNPDGTKSDADLSAETRLVVGGRDPFAYHGFVNPPVYHASTVLYPSADDLIAHRARWVSGSSWLFATKVPNPRSFAAASMPS